MLPRFLRYVALSTALFYNACLPPDEEDLESKCQGEVLFEDEFGGEELDERKWDVAQQNDQLVLNEGVLEIYTRGGAGLQSRSIYTLGDDTLCFEARWKVREREGTYMFSGITRDNSGAVGFESDSQTFYLGTQINNNCDEFEETNINTDDYHLFTLKINRDHAQLYVDGESKKSINKCIPADISKIDFTCNSDDGKEKQCLMDYVKLFIK